MTTDASDAWKLWHEHRVEAVSEPYGPLALIGTHWLDDHPDGRLPSLPGTWALTDDGVTLGLRQGLHVVEPESLYARLQVRHLDQRLPADIDPSEEHDVAHCDNVLGYLRRP